MRTFQLENSTALGPPMQNAANESELHASRALDPREAGFLILALEHHAGVQAQAVPDLLRQLVRGPQSPLQSAQNIDGEALARKLDCLDDSVLQAVIAGARVALTLPSTFLLAAPGRFEQQALQAAGLAPLSEDPAWGFVIVRLANYWWLELPVRHDPSQIDFKHDHALADVGRGLRDYAERALARGAEAHDDIGYKMACYLLKKTGRRHLRVEESLAGDVEILEITVKELRSDLVDGSMQPLMLVGVNAPFV
ncbi:hypothetical protein [Methylorubrum extorquens]|uniref:hypothetical protein n=1 Tax=Methylorubrum extorquens TaxID=408 RepID=UPI001EE5A5F5|nr:hypothetical protein [Methylorubrum extorquens]MCG5249497.1 hypothetical protein [Methylorubrum extorquens]